MEIRPEVAAQVAEDLRHLGYKAEYEAQEVTIILPLLCRVAVRFREGGVTFSPRFGTSSRTLTTWMVYLLVFFFVLVITWRNAAVAPRGGFVWLLIAMFMLTWDVYRYILTESAMGVVRSLLVSRYAA